MNTFEEKMGLLSEMIAFATVDGKLHHREYEFLVVVAKELNIAETVFIDLFHQELPQKVIQSEFERYHQFYRLALLMHIDGVLHPKEEIAIHQIVINMGLNLTVTTRILKMMKMNKTPIINEAVLIEVFKEQHN